MLSRPLRRAALGALALVVVGVGAAVAGGDIEDKLRTGDAVNVAEGEVVTHDLYVFGGNVIVDGTVNGDLVAASGSVTINGSVDGDVVAGTGELVINGEVAGDARVGAGRITVSGTVGEDLLAGAGQLTIQSGGLVGEDLIFGAGDVRVAGDVSGSIYGTASTYSRTGSAGSPPVSRVTFSLPPTVPVRE